MQLLKGKTAIVTGATRGIGRGVAIKLAEQGANVVFTYVSSEEKALAIEKELKDMGVKAKAYRSDASKMGDAEALVKDVLENFDSIDVLVNNAGITDDNLFLRMSDDQWSKVINVNLSSTFKITKAAVKGMVKRRYGRIINISSVIGVLGGAGQANYSASKAAIIGMSKSLAQELGSRSITVNCIAPGFIETNMTSELNDSRRDEILKSIVLKRLGLPNDISGAVSYLASDSASYITGQTLHINGGMLMV